MQHMISTLQDELCISVPQSTSQMLLLFLLLLLQNCEIVDIPCNLVVQCDRDVQHQPAPKHPIILIQLS